MHWRKRCEISEGSKCSILWGYVYGHESFTNKSRALDYLDMGRGRPSIKLDILSLTNLSFTCDASVSST